MTSESKTEAASSFELESNSSRSKAEEEPFVISNYQIFLVVMNLMNHVLVLATVCFVCYASRDLTWVTNRHAILCTIGYVLLMAEAIAALADENAWTFCLSRRANSHLHWILQVIGACLSVYGVADMYMQKERHFRSTHAILGIVSVACIAVVFLSGLPALFAASLRKTVKPVISKLTHNSLGIFCFVMGMASQVAAYQKKYIRNEYGVVTVYLLTVTTVLITIFSLVGAVRQLNQQLRGVLRIMRK